MPLKLNCDLGESDSIEMVNVDAQVMPFIDQANIACGYHAGNELIMAQTVDYALQHKVSIGAHPSYPDRENFGRKSMNIPTPQLIELIQEQIMLLSKISAKKNAIISYVKPHGALYNDMMINGHIRSAVMQAISDSPGSLAFMLQATPRAENHQKEAEAFGIELIFEVFADRCYTDEGALLSRSMPGAVHSRKRMLEQVRQLNDQGSLTTVNGLVLPLSADSLCVHGDNAEGVAAIADIRHILS
jgi:UPF0271 protein